MANQDRKIGTLSDAQKAYVEERGLDYRDRQKKMLAELQKLFGFKKADKLGTSLEAPGGGTGSDKNFLVARDQEEMDQMKEDNPRKDVRIMQPRDEKGQFATNAMNLRETKYPGRAKHESEFFDGTSLDNALNEKGEVDGTENITGESIYKSNLKISGKEEKKDLSNNFGEFANRLLNTGGVVKKKGRRTKEATELIKNGYEGFIKKTKGRKIDWANDSGLYNKKGEGEEKPTPKPAPKPEQPKPTPTPEQPKESPKPEQPSGGISDDDVKMASENPDNFMRKYKNEIKEIQELAKSKGKDINAKALVKLVQSGRKNVFEDLKKKLNS